MNNNKGTSYRWILLPILFSSATVIAGGFGGVGHTTEPTATEQAVALTADDDGFLDDSQELNNVNMNYVGGNTRIGVGIDTEFKGRIDGSHIFMETENSVTSGEGYLGINPMADEDEGEEIVTGVGAKVNHHWVTRDDAGNPLHVNKVFGAYDQNEAEDKKITGGYGQERENMFWSGHISKGLSDKRETGQHDAAGNHIYEKAYDYGVGGRVGTFLNDQLMRVQGGIDFEWGTEQHDSEDMPSNLTVTGGVEKFFPDSPHSVAANVEVSKSNGGYAADEHEADVSGNVSYRYDFGGAGLFASDEQYRRVRVEIPGKTEVVKIKKKRPPKVERKLVKHTMELEADTFFKKGDFRLTHEAQQRLRAMMGKIRETGHHGAIRITGNTCDLGAHQNNQALSERRAAQVRSFMIANGFKPNELLAQGLGETQPKYPNNDATRHRNRRVDIEYVSYQSNYKDQVVEQGYDVQEKVRVISEPRVVWRKELIPTPPSWVAQALRNNIQYKQRIDTYRTIGSDAVIDQGGNSAPQISVQNIQRTIVVDTTDMVDVLTGVTDPDGDQVSIVSFEQTANGTVTQVDGGKLMYTPNAGFTGTESFTYIVTDGQGNNAEGTITITVTPAAANNLVANDDHASTDVNMLVAIDVLNNDTDADDDVITIDTFQENSAHGGTVELQDGLLVYTPAQDFTGTDTFTYTITDGTDTASATVTVVVGSDGGVIFAPADDTYSVGPESLNDKGEVDLYVLENDTFQGNVTIRLLSHPQQGSIQNADGSGNITDGFVAYLPANESSGTDTFTYILVDQEGNESGPATVTINLPGSGDGSLKLTPDGTQGELPGDSYSFYTNDTVTRTLDVLANDVGNELTIISVSRPTPDRGTPQISADGKSILYTLRHGECEDHSFEYTVQDKDGNTATTTVYINILDDGKAASI